MSAERKVPIPEPKTWHSFISERSFQIPPELNNCSIIPFTKDILIFCKLPSRDLYFTNLAGAKEGEMLKFSKQILPETCYEMTIGSEQQLMVRYPTEICFYRVDDISILERASEKEQKSGTKESSRAEEKEKPSAIKQIGPSITLPPGEVLTSVASPENIALLSKEMKYRYPSLPPGRGNELFATYYLQVIDTQAHTSAICALDQYRLSIMMHERDYDPRMSLTEGRVHITFPFAGTTTFDFNIKEDFIRKNYHFSYEIKRKQKCEGIFTGPNETIIVAMGEGLFYEDLRLQLVNQNGKRLDKMLIINNIQCTDISATDTGELLISANKKEEYRFNPATFEIVPLAFSVCSERDSRFIEYPKNGRFVIHDSFIPPLSKKMEAVTDVLKTQFPNFPSGVLEIIGTFAESKKFRDYTPISRALPDPVRLQITELLNKLDDSYLSTTDLSKLQVKQQLKDALRYFNQTFIDDLKKYAEEKGGSPSEEKLNLIITNAAQKTYAQYPKIKSLANRIISSSREFYSLVNNFLEGPTKGETKAAAKKKS